MSALVRDGEFDVVVAAGPGVPAWPTAGARVIAMLCAEMELSVGLFGGESVAVRGVIPSAGTGGLALVEDVQTRLHRIRARSIVRVSAKPELPDPFEGWRSPGLIPLATARRLRQEAIVAWEPATVILGTGNAAFRFGSELLEAAAPGSREVFCVETSGQWGAKRFAGWEVERRRFEAGGGRVLEAVPVSLTPKGALRWEFRLRDERGVRVLDVARVVSAGPFASFQDSGGAREHPAGSLLFELPHTALPEPALDPEGWAAEEIRAKWLAGRIVRALVTDLAPARRAELDRAYKLARGRFKRYQRHREQPHTPSYSGKWLAVPDGRAIREFSGAPQEAHRVRRVASIECFEEIPCDFCARACPTDAIAIGKIPRRAPVLTELACIGCGACVQACPSAAPIMIQEKEDHPQADLVLAWRGTQAWKTGDTASLVNRRGETLGSGRVQGAWEVPAEIAASLPPMPSVPQLVSVQVPAHLAWEARALRRVRNASAEDLIYMQAVQASAGQAERVEITLNGEKRWVRDRTPVSVALFETGQARADDVLYCPDGSCHLCQISADGVRKRACQTLVHRGMSIRTREGEAGPAAAPPGQAESLVCPCLGITAADAIERIRAARPRSPDAALSVTHVGEGKCHGRLCMGAFARLLEAEGVSTSDWVDWRFPWSEWVLGGR